MPAVNKQDESSLPATHQAPHFGTLTVADVRQILAALPDDAVVVVRRPDRDGA